MNELAMVTGVDIIIVLKVYRNRITGAVRSTRVGISAGTIAEHFGGGGHSYAAGFKLDGNTDIASVKTEAIQEAMKLLQ